MARRTAKQSREQRAITYEKTNFTIPADVLKKAREKSAKTGIPMSRIAANALRDWSTEKAAA